ncbi:MAG: hypothetical protein AB1586_29190 [Pseudomonadota bacterium]|jgi:hypothetical protein
MHSTAPIAAALALAACVLGAGGTGARADAPLKEQPPQDRAAPPDAQSPQPVRIILPAPWEPAAPTRPATTPPKPRAN